MRDTDQAWSIKDERHAFALRLNMTHHAGGLLRATILASLAALTLSTQAFVSIDRIRVKVVQAPAPAAAGVVRSTTAGQPQVNALRPPFALIARISSASAGTTRFSISVDGALACERDVTGGGAQRVDCAVTAHWDPTTTHEVAVQGPPTGWSLESLELATHHGSTGGAHYLVVLPASSGRYVRPGPGWVIATWVVLLAALLFLPTASPLPRWVRLLHRAVAGVVVLELALIQCSQWVSDYRVVLSAGTFARLLVLLFALRLWVGARLLARRAATYLDGRPVARRTAGLAAVFVLVCLSVVTAWQISAKDQREQLQVHVEQQLHTRREQGQIQRDQAQSMKRSEQTRRRLFAELQPVSLANCTFQRFGEPHDGGYVLCANLLASVRSAYSYGIEGYDRWGCDVSRLLGVTVHQYDCFDLRRPLCLGGRAVFHEECVAGEPATIDGRLFDTPESQFVKNGDAARRLVVKMDVEGAEWETLLLTPDAVLQQIDQLAIEFHGGYAEERSIAAVMKLKQYFHVADLHFNNFTCQEGTAPFPADVYEVLFVNKRVGVPGGPGPAGAPPGLLAPNNPHVPDCQAATR